MDIHTRSYVTEQQQQHGRPTPSPRSRSRRGAGRHTTLTVKQPPPCTSDSNHLHNHANRARKSWRSDVASILPGWRRHTGGSRSIPTVHPADLGLEAVGCSVHKHYTSPINTTHGRVKSRKKGKIGKMKNGKDGKKDKK